MKEGKWKLLNINLYNYPSSPRIIEKCAAVLFIVFPTVLGVYFVMIESRNYIEDLIIGLSDGILFCLIKIRKKVKLFCIATKKKCKIFK